MMDVNMIHCRNVVASSWAMEMAVVVMLAVLVAAATMICI